MLGYKPCQQFFPLIASAEQVGQNRFSELAADALGKRADHAFIASQDTLSFHIKAQYIKASGQSEARPV